MLIKIVFLSFSSLLTSLLALTLTVNTGRENKELYSTIHIKESFAFRCVSEVNDFNEISQIQCIFPREPSEKFSKIKTNIFKIDSFTKNKKYYIRILPLEKMKLFPIKNKLYEDKEIRSADQYKLANHWMILGFKNTPPFIKEQKYSSVSLNLPVTMDGISRPSVGSLDISGLPIHLDQVKDVGDYMRIKTAYESGHYTKLSNDVDTLFKNFPDTIFRAELLLLKMRGLHHTNENEDLLKASKEFIRDYSDEVSMGEVLAYTANAYSAVGLEADGTYFYERLFTEYPNSKFAALGMIFLGDQYSSSGKARQAYNYFEKALYMTDDVEIASMAAIRLAKINLEKGEITASAKLYEKIIEGNAAYLLHDIDGNYDNARAFANRKHQMTAANILKAMTKNLPVSDENYESMMKNIGLWLAETSDKSAAYTALKAYQKRYKEGLYLPEVQTALDSLFYASEDANVSALITEYEVLEKKYPNEEIGYKATYNKAKLFYKLNRYEDVISLDGSGAENEVGYFELKEKAVFALVEDTLLKGKCSKAIGLSMEHNVSLDSKYDSKFYGCAYKTGNYALAKTISSKHLKDKNERLAWLYKYAKTLGKTNEYEQLSQVAEDIIVLSDLEKTSKYDDILQDTFYAYERMNKPLDMIRTIKELEKRRGLSYEDIELYVSMINLGLKQKDEVIVEGYAKKVMRLQDKTKSYSQSPFVEFAALQVLKSQNKEKAQLNLLNKLVKRDLDDKDLSRVQYVFGSIYMRKGNMKLAKASFEKSIEIDEKSAWASLSKDALELIP